jgi:hypothetical protein
MREPVDLETALSGPGELPLAEAAFCKWAGEAAHGDILEYHRGFLSVDIEVGRLPASERKVLRQLAHRAAWAFREGVVHLVQRRRGPDDFSYLAIKRTRPRATRLAGAKLEQDSGSLDARLEEE